MFVTITAHCKLGTGILMNITSQYYSYASHSPLNSLLITMNRKYKQFLSAAAYFTGGHECN